jgi:hypothetical protein
MHFSRRWSFLVVAITTLSTVKLASSAPVVPGTGMKLANVGDDFEDPNWLFRPNLPKSSEEQDERVRHPMGRSVNGRWYEGMKRGCPDVVRVVPTPPGGLEGSQFSLLMSSVRTGVPGRPSYQMQQDDLIANVWQRVGQKIPVQHTPSVMVRVFMPPIKTWENRSGPTFGFRTSLETHTWKVPDEDKERPRFFGGAPKKKYVLEPYWPGMFVEFGSETDRNRQYDTAYWRIRGNTRGAEVRGPAIETTGWWTLGMSVTPDGMVHYYIKQGIEDLTVEDYVTSQYPYGYRAETFKTFFFNVCNLDDMRTKSTDWIVDDPAVFIATPPPNMAQQRRTQR